MEFLYPLIFAVFIIFIIGSAISQYTKNEASPQLTVEARVVEKKEETTMHAHTSTDGNGVTHTHHTHDVSYYVRFQVESGDTLRFHVRRREFNELLEGDFGRLTFQGTRYQGFERIV